MIKLYCYPWYKVIQNKNIHGIKCSKGTTLLNVENINIPIVGEKKTGSEGPGS